MKLCRFQTHDDTPRAGLLTNDDTMVVDLGVVGVFSLNTLFEGLDDGSFDRDRLLGQVTSGALPAWSLDEVRLLSPVERQEVWAAGVTYLRSKKARMEESETAASLYDLVYEAERPELFFKSLPEKVVAPGEPVGIRRDAKWNVPEPELALVITSRGTLAGFTIGNDMSSRDIEGENALYLPQAKVYTRSCAIGPWVRMAADEQEARSWRILLDIRRGGESVFAGETNVGQIKRSFSELIGFLCRSQLFPNGVVLLTGTGVVPPETFTLQSGDEVRITVSGIGTLQNTVVEV